MSVAQPSAKEVLTAMEHVFAAEGGLAESAVKYPLRVAGQYAALGHGLKENVEAELLGRVQAAVASIPEFIRPPVPSKLEELRLELPQGATAIATAGADDGAAAAAFADSTWDAEKQAQLKLFISTTTSARDHDRDLIWQICDGHCKFKETGTKALCPKAAKFGYYDCML